MCDTELGVQRLLCISNRRLCAGDFVTRILRILERGIPVVLREKDLSEEEYYDLLCRIGSKEIIAHSFIGAARRFGCKKIHLPLPLLERADISGFSEVGASTHSVDEAKRAKALGATYITAGHIFATDCKKGLPPVGLRLIRDIKENVDIFVYGLGGIDTSNMRDVLSAGADGVAMMSEFMREGSKIMHKEKLF